MFKLDSNLVYTELYVFTGGTDGRNPVGGVALDNNGNLYGTASLAGDHACGDGAGCGTVFEITP